MRIRSLLGVILLPLLIVSCRRSGIIEESTIMFENPVEIVSLMADSEFSLFSEIGDPAFIQICNDTILVVQERINDENSCHFKAFSTVSCDCLGAFVHFGRGPGELVSPRMERSFSSESCLRIIENGSATRYIVDVERSIQPVRNTVYERIDSLPIETIESLSLGGSADFIIQMDGQELVYRVISDDGTVIRTFRPYRRINSLDSMTMLSGIILSNEIYGKVAEIMLFLPQLNIFNAYSGEIHSIAVDKKYLEWSTVMRNLIGPETVQYYQAATASADYIFAVYDNVSLGKMLIGDYCSSVHVFDWEGDFIYEFKVNERLSDITYDAESKALFAIDRTNGRIIRYDLKRYL